MSAEATSLSSPAKEHENALIPSGVLGMLVFIACEIMYFAALFSAYLVVSAGASEWPPADQPRLPIATSTFNTLILLLSGFLVFRSNKQFRASGVIADAKKCLGWAIACGAFFVAFQGLEWVRLIDYGLTMQSSSYGSFFYLIVGSHALHAFIAIVLLGYQYLKLNQGKLRDSEFWTMQVFWYFVVGVWPFLFVLVYLNGGHS